MKRDLRIIFMGTPDFAVATLKSLVEAHYTIVGVITTADKPSGRGRKLKESAVKVYAKSQGLHILQPTNLKNESFIAELQALNANLQIVVAFRMLPKIVWQMPKYGTFNLHASLLPNYRGAAPINWAIINGEETTGVTTFFIDEKIDTGAIIGWEDIKIEAEDNAGSLHDKLMQLGSTLVIDTVKMIESGDINTTTQPEIPDVKTAFKLNKENCKIDWKNSIDNIHNKIRGLSPYPAAWCYLQNNGVTLDIKIYKAKKEIIAHQNEIGRIIATKKEIKVAVNGGYINILQIKLPNKKMMSASALLNGYEIHEQAKMR